MMRSFKNLFVWIPACAGNDIVDDCEGVVNDSRKKNYYQRSERNIGGKKPILRHLHNFLCHSGLDPESRK